MSPPKTIERLLTTVGNKQGISNAVAFGVTAAFAAALLGFGLLSKLPIDSQFAWAAGAVVPVWFLSSGILETLGASYATDRQRQEHSGSRILVGLAKAFSALILLICGALYLFLL